MENEEVLKTELTLEKREKKIANWFKNKYNIAFFLLIVFAVLIRIYYFLVTQNQPVWWDEAEYMNLARRFAFREHYWVDPARQILFSFIASIFLRVSDTEFLPRLFLMIISIASVISVYYMGKEMYNKKIALIAGFFMSVFYMNLFFTSRLLNDVSSLTFFTFSVFFFYKYLKNNSAKMLYLSSAMIAIGTLFKLTTASLLFVFFIYLLVTEKLKFLKKKEIWMAIFIFIIILMPYIIWGYYEYHGFVILKAQETITSSTPEPLYVTGPKVVSGYIQMLPWYLFSASSQFYGYLSLILVFGLIILSMYRLVIGFDILLREDKEKTSELKRDFYLILLLLVPFILVSFLISHNEDRYILNSFPALFIIFGIFIMKGFDYFNKRKMKTIGIIVVLILVGSFCYIQIKQSDMTIKSKVNSYAEVREVANWLRENTNSSDVLISSSAYQVQYYSRRESFRFTTTLEELEKIIIEKHPKYYMISKFEGNPEYASENTPELARNSYQIKNNFTLARAYFVNPQQTDWFIKIYEIPKGFVPGKADIKVSEKVS